MDNGGDRSNADAWDKLHVRLPCSPHNTFSSTVMDGGEEMPAELSQWFRIKTILSAVARKKITLRSAQDLKEAIVEYDGEGIGDVSGLESYLSDFCDGKEKELLLTTLLPLMAQCAITLEDWHRPLKLLKPFKNDSITLTQREFCSLLANMFFCTFPPRGAKNLPSVNFGTLFAGQSDYGAHFDDNPPQFEDDDDDVDQSAAVATAAAAAAATTAAAQKTSSGNDTEPDDGDDDDDDDDDNGKATPKKQQKRRKTMACSTVQAGKFNCIFNYFKRRLLIRNSKTQSNNSITVARQCMPDPGPDWANSTNTLAGLVVAAEGTIEESANHLQLDFANKTIGGGVLGYGAVQEEIRFLICPELIALRLFCPTLKEDEAIVVTGVEQYSTYVGYSSTFAFGGDFVDKTPVDSQSRRKTVVVAVDATRFYTANAHLQFSKLKILREINKFYAGIMRTAATAATAAGASNSNSNSNQDKGKSSGRDDCCYDNFERVATGGWGCGVFRGDFELKSLLQLIAASYAHRSLTYYTFHDDEAQRKLEGIYALLKKKNVVTGQLYDIIITYGGLYLDFVRKNHSVEDTTMTLFEFVRRKLEDPTFLNTSAAEGFPLSNTATATTTATSDNKK